MKLTSVSMLLPVEVVALIVSSSLGWNNIFCFAWVSPSIVLRSGAAASATAAGRTNNIHYVPPTTKPLFASVEETIETTAATSISDTYDETLRLEYTNALEHGVAMLTAKIPEKYQGTMLPLLIHFASEYMRAAQKSYDDFPEEYTNPVVTMERFIKLVSLALQYGFPNSPDYYTFDVSHVALRGDQVGYGRQNFYKYGNDFFRHCMDFNNKNNNNNKKSSIDDDAIQTHVLGYNNLQIALEQMKNGDNVIFFANHQSEADPQVVSLCFDLCGEEYSKAAADMVYVAGHKVTTDVLAIPFSMGRNLICIHSKKHIDADKETKPLKQRQNLKAMNALLRLLKQGGCMIWVAPSGGRDRRDLATGTVPVAPFDSKTIDMFRLMGNKSDKPTHYYTMAMVSYDLCPPPDTVEAQTGEKRNVRYVPVGIKVGNELESVGGLESRQDFCQTAMSQCVNDYNEVMNTLEEYIQSKKKSTTK